MKYQLLRMDANDVWGDNYMIVYESNDKDIIEQCEKEYKEAIAMCDEEICSVIAREKPKVMDYNMKLDIIAGIFVKSKVTTTVDLLPERKLISVEIGQKEGAIKAIKENASKFKTIFPDLDQYIVIEHEF